VGLHLGERDQKVGVAGEQTTSSPSGLGNGAWVIYWHWERSDVDQSAVGQNFSASKISNRSTIRGWQGIKNQRGDGFTLLTPQPWKQARSPGEL